MENDRLKAYVRLRLAEGVGPILFRRLVDAFGDVQAVRDAGHGAWRGVEGIGPQTADAIAAVSDEQVEEELALARQYGAAIICLDDPAYPAALKTIHDPPPVLYVRGQLEPADALALAIVGARRCTHYGMEQSQRFGGLLGRAGFTVVSGGARGIDAAAHRGALEVGGRTIAVMGCGLCQTYPPENVKLFEQIIGDGSISLATSDAAGPFAGGPDAMPLPARDEGHVPTPGHGAVISELPMRTAVLPGNFPTRNRIISGLSLGVLVVEAARHSGSLHTAGDAGEQGRAVFALPGRVDSPTSQGANELIRNGATLVQDLDDILGELGPVGEKMRSDEAAPGGVGRAYLPDGSPDGQAPLFAAPTGLTATEAALATALADGPLNLDDLLRRTGLETGKAASAMTMLVLKGVVAQRPGNAFELKRTGKVK
jgi:DNA processing protein